MEADEMLVFGGSGSRKLTKRICQHLGVPPAGGEVLHFSEGNLFVRVHENVRGRNVYVVQTVAFPANDNFMELLFWIDALKRASAESVTAVIPYFSYAKGDKKDQPRVSIRARVCADAIEAAGADRVVTVDLHAPQIQGFFRVPVDDLYAIDPLCQSVRKFGLSDLVVVSPDAGFAKKARIYASRLGAPLAITDKSRVDHSERAVVHALVGEVADRAALIVDDFVIGAGTLVAVAEELVARGARSVRAAITHGVFANGSMQLIDTSPLEHLFVTDTIETQPVKPSRKVQTVSIAPLLGEAIRRIHNRQSVSVLFDT
jgi:ribose-phosphate pyrophosphokinase